MRIPCEDPVRRRLAETAARRAAAGQDSAPVLAGLRRLNLQLLLAPAPPPRRPQDLAGAAHAVCTAAQAAARRRPGWLYAMLPPNAVWPVRAHGALVQAALLAALRGVLAQGGQGVLRCAEQDGAVWLCFQGGAPRACTAALWRRLAQECGGAAVFGTGHVFTAAARLPLCGGRSGRRARSARGAVRPVFAAVPVFGRMGRAAVARAARPRRNAQKTPQKAAEYGQMSYFFDFRC